MVLAQLLGEAVMLGRRLGAAGWAFINNYNYCKWVDLQFSE